MTATSNKIEATIETDTYKGFKVDDLERTLKRHANRADPNGPFASAVASVPEQLRLGAAIQLFHGRTPGTHGRISETDYLIISSQGRDW